MSININYNALKNMSAQQRTELTLNNIPQSKDDDLNLNQSIFKSYLDTLREKSDEAAQKTLKELENTPITAVGKLFGNLQVNSVDQVSKIFDDLRIKPNDEIGSILDNIRSGDAVKARQPDLTERLIKKDAAQDIKKSEEAKNTEKPGDRRSFLEMNLDHAGDKMSKENNALNEQSKQVSEAALEVRAAAERDEISGERDMERLDGAAEKLVSRYNTFADTVNSSKNSTVNSKAEFISDMLDAYSSRLEKVGITKDEDGRLSLDREKLEQANDKDIERAFGKEDSFAEFIDGQAKQLSAYAQTDLYQKAGAYNDGGNITQVSNISGSYFNMLG
ncbi:MAG: hypothetical protein J6N15_03285 [Ruminiclostridium sp.]|nr:hypothetical protein [Ruminiclostridium sp.]